MYVYRSNRTEVLAEKLAEVVRQPVGAPMQPESIVVQGPGMQRWLTLVLSRRLGVWANPQFPFPRTIIGDAISAVLPQQAPTVFEPLSLFWAVAEQLNTSLGQPAYRPLVNYLRGDGSGRKLFQLAQRVAKTFDRYALYRPQLVREWEQGKGDDWQACLWRSVVQAHDPHHIANQLQRFLQQVNAQPGPISGFPQRLCLFGISALPPLYTRALAALSERIPVHLFVLSPSREFWGDLERRAEVEIGNPLLSSLGRLAGDFQQVLEEQASGYEESGEDLYQEPMPDGPLFATLLSSLQSDMLALRHCSEPRPLSAGDESVSVHSCHSPLRELEVLHDQLVARFDADVSLQPQDVIVMAPNVEAYAPLIDAVFGADIHDRPHIPYRISDRADRSTAPVLQAYSQVLETLRGRMTASELMDLLGLASVRDKFEIGEKELPQIKQWVVESGIRWGVDAAARGSVEQPEFVENTWRFGLDRLLLGYAMTGQERLQFGEVLPYDDMEGSVTASLGRLVAFCETLFSFREVLSQPLAVEHWSGALLQILDALIVATEKNQAERQMVREATARIADGAASGGFTGKVPFETIFGLLEDSWQQGDSVKGFLSGGVTFCQLMPMRSIPFRVVCVLGMSDGEFPRSPAPLGFDLLAADPKMGDRTPRDEDRYLFLEAILSARDCLLITYVGQSIQNNTVLPPSVLVGELLEVLSDSFQWGAGDARQKIVVQHPLQPFSPRYFASSGKRRFDEVADASLDCRLFSYSVAYCEGARSMSARGQRRPGFLTDRVQLPASSERELTVDELVNFFRHPAKHWMEHRLGLFLPQAPEALEDREPMALMGLAGYRVGDQLLARAMLGENVTQAYPSLRAAGNLPLGRVGECAVERLKAEVGEMAGRIVSVRNAEGLDAAGLPGVPIDMLVNGTRITGALEQLWPGGRVIGAYSRTGGSTELGHWIRHLFLCALAPEQVTLRTSLVGRSDASGKISDVAFSAVDNPMPLIEQMVCWYWAGQEAPLPFFCRAGQAFVRKLKGQDAQEVDPRVFDEALSAAYSRFTDGAFVKAEAEDAYIRRAFDVRRCLNPDYVPFDNLPEGYELFPQLANAMYRPLLAARGSLLP